MKDTWIQTYTGRQFWPLDPKSEDVDIEDIAHALSMKCRFTGHSNQFYSIAEHSVLVSYYSIPDYGLEGLLHDAAEAYLPDVSRPIKPYLTGFYEIQQRIEVAIADRFGLRYEGGWAFENVLYPQIGFRHGWPGLIRDVDTAILADEQLFFMPNNSKPWTQLTNGRLGINHFDAWCPAVAKEKFLQCFSELLLRKLGGDKNESKSRR